MAGTARARRTAAGRAGRRHPGAGGVRPARVRHRGHLDPAPQPDQPRRPDAARRLPQLGAGAAADAGAADRGTQPGPAAVELLRARRRSRRAHLDGGQRPRRRTRAARRQRRGSRAGHRRLDRPLGCSVAGDDGARAARRADHRRHRPVRRSVDGARVGLRAGRHRVRGAAGARRRRLLRWSIAACARWSRSSRPPRRSPPASSIAVSRT